ncbi:antitoxin [Actinocrispum wychmicini]|uniref:Antitoxin protein of toxin-antitoxin system n=1 Tax=Actinocrispum wychmicini TaxID=1213861 RepID=A0A4R2JVI9_9PSEU|nr:antitoxin [Actinocrispum wychmicini]TCO64443.1 antitoxin protein of toxin-antitoxin system [Actinocrispum wychmicini]
MGINFDELKNKAGDLLNQHGDKIEDGLEKVGDFAKKQFGHDEQIDKVVDKAKDMIPDKPTTDDPADNT